MDILSKGNTHRAPVVNETRDVIGYVTQSKLLSWALKNKDEVKQAMQEKIKSGHTPITINMREFVIEVKWWYPAQHSFHTHRHTYTPHTHTDTDTNVDPHIHTLKHKHSLMHYRHSSSSGTRKCLDSL